MDLRYELPARCRLDKVCASEDSRYRLNQILALPNGKDEAHLVATNGKILAVVPVGASTLETEPALLPREAGKAGAKGAKVDVNGEIRVTQGKRIDVHPTIAQEGRFPSVQAVIPDTADSIRLTLDAGLLADLAGAIAPGTNHVTLYIPQPNEAGDVVGAIGVVGDVGDGAHVVPSGIGAIMPMTTRRQDDETLDSMEHHYRAIRSQLPAEAIELNREANA